MLFLYKQNYQTCKYNTRFIKAVLKCIIEIVTWILSLFVLGQLSEVGRKTVLVYTSTSGLVHRSEYCCFINTAGRFSREVYFKRTGFFHLIYCVTSAVVSAVKGLLFCVE